MWELSNAEILEATGGRLLFGELNGTRGVSIDSRTIKEGELFVAIKGPRFDGHDFIFEALNRGGGAIVSVPPSAPPRGKPIIFVENTLGALQDIARYLRRKRDIKVVGITGSNGKSTTKEMLAAILDTSYRVLKSTGNLNNQVGLPLSLLTLGPEDEVAVLEMGASAPGDIRELCSIAEPDYGVLTNVSAAHLEGFENVETVRDTKLEMMGFVKSLAANAEDIFLMAGLGEYPGELCTYGFGEIHDVYATEVALGERDSAFTLNMGGRSARVKLPVGGRFNVLNALAAAAGASFFGLDADQVARGFKGFKGIPMRLEIREFDGATVISDVYNANPASMEEALKELIRLRRGRAVAVLGDMLDLGSYEEAAHKKLGSWMADGPVDMLIAVGPLMALAAEEFSSRSSKECIKAKDSIEARALLRKVYREDDTILIKGSRSMRMELVLNGNGEGVDK